MSPKSIAHKNPANLRWLAEVTCTLVLVLSAASATAAELWITPSGPVALDGLRELRIASKGDSPLTVTALALEPRDGNQVVDQAILVSCDLIAIRPGILKKVRDKIKPRLPASISTS